jgi:hypothetical protein
VGHLRGRLKCVLCNNSVVSLIKQHAFLVFKDKIYCAFRLCPIHWQLSSNLRHRINTADMLGLSYCTAMSKPLHIMDLTSRQDDGGFKLYHYDPSMAAAAAFIILFIIASVIHCWQMFRTRCWIMVPLVIGGFCSLFVLSCDTCTLANFDVQWKLLDTSVVQFRAKSHQTGPSDHTLSKPYSYLWPLCVLPNLHKTVYLLTENFNQALFAATIYMEFGRLVTRLGAEQYTVIRHKWITKIFVTGDVLSFFLQGGGMCNLYTPLLLLCRS